VTASPGKVWLGTGKGTIEQVDSQTGTFDQSIPLITGEGLGYYLVPTLEFNGQYIAALEVTRDLKSLNLFAIEPDSGKVAHQWDLQSPEWSKESRLFTSTVLGVSPGKIWVDGHVIDTQTFDVKKVSMLPMTRFGYNGKGWMWITGDSGGSCDDLIFVNTDDLSEVVCQPRLPFLVEPNHVYPDVSIMALARDRMWMVTGGEGGGQPLTITAYPADIDQLMKTTKPLSKVTLMYESHQIKMLYAGNYLWLLWMAGDKPGFLYQLDPQTGETIHSLDLVGDQGRSKGDIPRDLATEGKNLWIVTMFQLLRIQLP
jgi:outer membrane protein assembly factor BamB